jgi:hypothetical protein
MSIKHFACVCVLTIAAACPGASEAGSLHGSLDGFVSGTITMGIWDDYGNITYEDTYIKNVPATLTFEIEPTAPGGSEYSGDMYISGYGGAVSDEYPSTIYIHYGQSGSPGASAGGSFDNDNASRYSESGSFRINDPTGLYIASGGAADPIGVSARASYYYYGGDGAGTFIAYEEISFQGEGPEPPAPASVPEPSSILLLVVGIPALVFREHRRAPR